jgi:hypothetical protein
MKKIIAIIFYYTGISYFLFLITHRKNTIRAVNYHCTPFSDMVNFESQLLFYKKHFRNITSTDLLEVLTGKTKSCKPGIILSFDDGLRSNFDFALPLLEKYGFTGWFFVPAGFMEQPGEDFAKKNSITYRQNYPDKRYGFNQDELKRLADKHIIGCHTYTHHRMKVDDTELILKHELVTSKTLIENMIQMPVNIFCWVGGELEHYTHSAQFAIKMACYHYSFTTNNQIIHKQSNPLNLNRTNIESNNSISMVLFQLSGVLDFLYKRKRAKVDGKFVGI